jgi:hypothetical protein
MQQSTVLSFTILIIIKNWKNKQKNDDLTNNSDLVHQKRSPKLSLFKNGRSNTSHIKAIDRRWFIETK